MRKRIVLPMLGLLCGIVLLAAGPLQAQPQQAGYDLSWYVVAAGQMGATGDNLKMGTTAGQTAIGWAENGHGLGTGFWYGARWALLGIEQSIYLPLVVKAYAEP